MSSGIFFIFLFISSARLILKPNVSAHLCPFRWGVRGDFMSIFLDSLLGGLKYGTRAAVGAATYMTAKQITNSDHLIHGSDMIKGFASGSLYAAKALASDIKTGSALGNLAATRDSISNVTPAIRDSISKISGDAVSSPIYSAPVASGAGTTAQLPDYVNADLAKAYGMDATTAYQEALSNTSYQRAVKDLQAAGLNPVLAAGQVAPAGGVYSAQLNGSGVNVSSGVSSAHGAYKFMSAAGGLVGTIIGALNGGTKGAYFGNRVGSSAGAAIGNLIDMI